MGCPAGANRAPGPAPGVLPSPGHKDRAGMTASALTAAVGIAGSCRRQNTFILGSPPKIPFSSTASGDCWSIYSSGDCLHNCLVSAPLWEAVLTSPLLTTFHRYEGLDLPFVFELCNDTWSRHFNTCNFSSSWTSIFLVQSYLIHQQHLATNKVTCGNSFTVGLGHKIKKLYLAEKHYGNVNGQKVIIHLKCNQDTRWQ